MDVTPTSCDDLLVLEVAALGTGDRTSRVGSFSFAFALFAASCPTFRKASVNGVDKAVLVVGDGCSSDGSDAGGCDWFCTRDVSVVDGRVIPVDAGAESSARRCLTSPYSFHSSISLTFYRVQDRWLAEHRQGQCKQRTPRTNPCFTRPGSCLFPARRPHNIRACSSVATSRA